MAYEFIEVQQKDGILVITMNDPQTRNSLGQQMGNEIFQELDRFETDPEGRVLVLTGRDPAFCSGANVRGFNQAIEDREGQTSNAVPLAEMPWGRMDSRYQQKPAGSVALTNLPLRLHQLQKPSIAAVNGPAYGIGSGLSLACDIRIASVNARFSEAFVQRGLIPADGSCWQLPRLVGLSNTFLLQYTGDPVPAEDALRIGLVSKMVPHDQLMSEAMALAQRLAKGATFSMSLIKYLILHSLNVPLEESLKLSHSAQELARQTDDHKEGVRAFLEKRPAQFKGR